MAMTSQFSDMMSSSTFFDSVLFLLSSLVTGPSFMSISSLDLELCQFFVIRDWPEIRKSEKPPSEFSRISGDWGKLGIPNLARMSLIKCYWMLQSTNQGYNFYHFWVIMGKPNWGRGGKIIPRLPPAFPPPHPDYG